MLGTGGIGTTTTVARNSAQVQDHAAMLLLIQEGHSKPNLAAAPDAGWMASSALSLVGGKL